jgi:hypothetical protein
MMTLFAMLCSVPSKMARRISNQSGKHDDYHVEYPQEQECKEEFRPPSPAPSYTENDVISSMLRRLGELEDKVQVLETKPSEMPFEKEELLNAAVRRVDALEAELISTKKVSLFFSIFGINWYKSEIHENYYSMTTTHENYCSSLFSLKN